jgi:hypothetical protein
MLGTVGMHGSTRLPLQADSQMDLSKSWNFNQFRLVMLKFGGVQRLGDARGEVEQSSEGCRAAQWERAPGRGLAAQPSTGVE